MRGPQDAPFQFNVDFRPRTTHAQKKKKQLPHARTRQAGALSDAKIQINSPAICVSYIYTTVSGAPLVRGSLINGSVAALIHRSDTYGRALNSRTDGRIVGRWPKFDGGGVRTRMCVYMSRAVETVTEIEGATRVAPSRCRRRIRVTVPPSPNRVPKHTQCRYGAQYMGRMIGQVSSSCAATTNGDTTTKTRVAVSRLMGHTPGLRALVRAYVRGKTNR